MNFYLEHNYSGEANVQLLPLPLETIEADSCIRGYHTYSAVLVATVGEQLQCAQERRNAKDLFAVLGSHCMNGSDIVGHISRKISRNHKHLELCFTTIDFYK